MDCSFIRTNLFSYQEKQLSYLECREFDEHLHSCEACSRIASGFQSVTSFIDKKQLEEPNPFIRTRIIQAIESEIEREDTMSKPFFQDILRPVFLSFFLLFGVIIGFSIVKQRNIQFTDTINHQNNIQSMKSDLNIPDFIEEDKTFFDNH
jgi:hypothetical protein